MMLSFDDKDGVQMQEGAQMQDGQRNIFIFFSSVYFLYFKWIKMLCRLTIG
jgi:hypothetical protein